MIDHLEQTLQRDVRHPRRNIFKLDGCYAALRRRRDKFGMERLKVSTFSSNLFLAEASMASLTQKLESWAAVTKRTTPTTTKTRPDSLLKSIEHHMHPSNQ